MNYISNSYGHVRSRVSVMIIIFIVLLGVMISSNGLSSSAQSHGMMKGAGNPSLAGISSFDKPVTPSTSKSNSDPAQPVNTTSTSKPNPKVIVPSSKSSYSISVVSKPTSTTSNTPTGCPQKLPGLYNAYSQAIKQENIRHNNELAEIDAMYYLDYYEKEELIDQENQIFWQNTGQILDNYEAQLKSAGC